MFIDYIWNAKVNTLEIKNITPEGVALELYQSVCCALTCEWNTVFYLYCSLNYIAVFTIHNIYDTPGHWLEIVGKYDTISAQHISIAELQQMRFSLNRSEPHFYLRMLYTRCGCVGIRNVNVISCTMSYSIFLQLPYIASYRLRVSICARTVS